MARSILILIIAGIFQLHAQIDTNAWINSIDTNSVVVIKNKSKIPSKYHSLLGVNSILEIANPGRKWNAGCVRDPLLPNKRLNWFALDSHKNVYLSYSTGGYAHHVHCIVVNTDKQTTISYYGISSNSSFMDFYHRWKAGLLRVSQ